MKRIFPGPVAAASIVLLMFISMPFDRDVVEWFAQHRKPWLTSAMKLVSHLADWTVSVAVVCIGVLIAMLRGRRAEALLLVAAAVGVKVVANVVKAGVDRERPEEFLRVVTIDNASFPSGHASQAVAIYGVLAFLAYGTKYRAPVGIAALVIITLVGISRTYLGVHWPSDVLGGWLLGAIWLLLCTTAYDRRRQVSMIEVEPDRQPVP